MSEVMNVGVMNVGQSQTITQVLTNAKNKDMPSEGTVAPTGVGRRDGLCKPGHKSSRPEGPKEDPRDPKLELEVGACNVLRPKYPIYHVSGQMTKSEHFAWGNTL